MQFKYLVAASVAGISACAMAPSVAIAQSTGSVEFEDDTIIIVTGVRATSVSGVDIPSTPRAKQQLDQEIIGRQRPGQTINDIINLVPGVSFQNNDPWGSSGGGFTIRGFGADRVSQTVDGIPLNDSGNYALYTNQQVDPEVLESVNVNLGVTDVDSPTASAAGGTVNIRTRRPSMDFGITATGTVGTVLADAPDGRPYYRAFGMVDTGDITGNGLAAFFSASYTFYENPFNNYGEVKKQQYNGRILQELGDDGDFISIAGHYNQNRNNFFGSQELNPADPLNDAFPDTREERFYNINFPCTIPAYQLGGSLGEGEDGVPSDADPHYSDSSGCGAVFDRRYNPSNTGNIRGSSRFTLGEGVILSIDPSFQYVKANGGGAEDLREAFFNGSASGFTDMTGFINGGYYYGMDLNGDGDFLDEVAGTDPSHTETHRIGVIASLAFELDADNRIRIAYTWDRARHRQTGATGFLQADGEPYDVFPINDPLITSDGFALNKRDRFSWAILHQVSGEYVGHFGDFTAVLGLRAPFFTRNLNQYCYTTSASGFVDCIGDQDPTAYLAANPDHIAPISVTYKYDQLLPSAGFVYDFGDASVFLNYAKGLSVPGTDPLYDSLYLINEPGFSAPDPETTDSFDLGLRFQSGDVQAQIAGWYTRYHNRLASAYDPLLDETIFRNLGVVDKYGLDASIAWNPTPNTLLYVFGSINESEIKDDVEDGLGVFLPTAGNRESGSPDFSIGARGQVRFGNFELGAQVKHTGERMLNDINSASIDSYTLVDVDLRWNVMELESGGNVAIQANITNLFDELFVGYFGGTLDDTSPFVQIGAPRAGSISLLVNY